MTTTVLQDTGTKLVRNLIRIASIENVRIAAMLACVELTRNFIHRLPPNKRGWPSTQFWQGVQVSGSPTPGGFELAIDNPERPGAFAFRHRCWVNGTGTINMKDKLLTIPARSEFYGQKATNFTNLRFVMFRSGAKALVIGKGGVGRVDFATGMEHSVRGAGRRTAMMVAYWLVESVTQRGKYPVIPDRQDYIDRVMAVLLAQLVELRQARGQV